MRYPSRLSTRINGHMEYLKSGKGSDWLKYQLSRSDTGLFKTYDFHLVKSLDTPLVEMSVLSINYWLTKFVQESRSILV